MTSLPALILSAVLLVAAPTVVDAAPMKVALFADTAIASSATGPASPAAAAACFRAAARMPSFGHVAFYPATGEAVYRLRFDGLVFETIRFVPDGTGGTHAQVQLAGSYSRAERAHFAAGRGQVLAQCLNQRVIMADAASVAVGGGL